MIRKRFLKDKTGPSLLFLPDENTKNSIQKQLEFRIQELEKTAVNSNTIIKTLEQKLAHAEAQAFKAFEEKRTEIKTLKDSIKKNLITFDFGI